MSGLGPYLSIRTGRTVPPASAAGTVHLFSASRVSREIPLEGTRRSLKSAPGSLPAALPTRTGIDSPSRHPVGIRCNQDQSLYSARIIRNDRAQSGVRFLPYKINQMTINEHMQSTNWRPEHFEPRAGQEAILVVNAADRIAARLLDLFYFRPAESQPVSLLAIVGCLDGTISAVSVADPDSLPGDVRDQVQMCRINERSRFRVITAPRIDVFRLDALRLNASGPGFNDPVQLFGSIQASIADHRGQPSIMLMHNEGRMIVGRIDLLHAMRQGMERPFVLAATNSTRTHHALIPGGESAGAGDASPLMLLYSLTDPALGDIADNEPILRHATYRLLAGLQDDMRRSGLQTRFTEDRLPVPDLAHYIGELKQDGYEIRGNAAYKTDSNREPQNPTLLGEFTRSIKSWFAPVIGLPREASLVEYGALIDEALAQVATGDDRKAMAEMIAVVTDGFLPTNAPPQVIPAVALPQATKTQRAEEDLTEPRVMQPAAAPSIPATHIDQWRDDFTPGTTRNRTLPQAATPWWEDFAEEPNTSAVIPLNGDLPASRLRAIDAGEASPGEIQEKPGPSAQWKNDFV